MKAKSAGPRRTANSQTSKGTTRRSEGGQGEEKREKGKGKEKMNGKGENKKNGRQGEKGEDRIWKEGGGERQWKCTICTKVIKWTWEEGNALSVRVHDHLFGRHKETMERRAEEPERR